MAQTHDIYTRHGLYRAGLTTDEVQAIAEADDLEACYNEDGWCGTWIDVEPCVVVPHGERLDRSAGYYLQAHDE